MNLVSFEAHKASRFLERSLAGFLSDPPDTDFQRGYLAALLCIYREGLGKGASDARTPLLEAMTMEGGAS